MKTPLNLLIVEDSPDDADLIVGQLKREGFDPTWRQVETEADFLAELKKSPEIILCDYAMPQFSGLRAAKLLEESALHIPFILVSGTVGEDAAVEAMKHGATDYLLKDRIARLGSAVRRALDESQLRRQRIQAEEELSRTHEALRQMLAHSPAVIYTLRIEGQNVIPVLASENMERLLGYTTAESMSYAWWLDGLHPEDRDLAVSTLAKGLAGGSNSMQYRFRHKNGTYRWIEDSSRVLCDAAGQPREVVGVWTDISDRKQAEIVLRESEEKFRQLAENINEVFWITDPVKHQMLYVSPAYERIWGRPCQALYQSPQSWLEAIHPEDRPRVLESFMTKQERGDYDETYRILRPNGAVRWIRDQAFPVHNPEGKLYRIVGTAEDITERRKLEEDKKGLEEQFLRAQRLENIGMLAGGIAHDLNNVLSPILMSCELLQELVQDEQIRETVEMIKCSAERGADLVKQVLSFARGVEGERLIVQPQHLIREMVDIVRKTFPKSICLHSDLPNRLWTLSADPTQLHQVLLNLCINARDAMPDGGDLTLSAENTELDANCASVSPNAKPGNYVLIKVTDSGCGIPAEMQDKIFAPFFTTKEAGHGTGLGLSTSLGIVKSHGGFVKLHSEPGAGSTFEVWLPAQSGPMPSAPRIEEIHCLRGQGQRILVADDEAAVRTLTKQTLEAYGYSVLTATNGAEAVALYARYKDEIEAVITDAMMPVMDGLALIRALKVIRPSVRVIACSGSPNEEFQSKILEAGAKRFLPKPYTVETIITSLDQVLRNQ